MPIDGSETYSIARYLGIDDLSDPTFTTDGTLLYLADTTGSPDVWRAAGDTPERLTSHSQRVSFVSASPTRPMAIFGMDRGSDERDQLFRYDLRDGRETDLTRDPTAIHSWGGWAPDGDRFAYAANRRTADTFDVHVQRYDEPASDSDRVLRGSGGFLSVEAWGPDGDRLALVDARASFAQDLYVLELAAADGSGAGLTRVNPDQDRTYADPTFGADGGLYARTNQPGDHTALVRFDLDAVDERPGEERASGRDDPAMAVVAARDGWNVDGHALDRETGRLAYTVNVDGYSELVVGTLDDPTTFRRTAAPDTASDAADPGVIETITWGPAGERLAVAHSASDRPHRILAVDCAAAEATTRVAASHGTLGIPASNFPAPEVIRYETFDGREIPAYWTLPPGRDDGDVPVIVDIHGGPEHQRRPWFYPMKAAFLERGYAVFEPNVRGSSGYGKAYTHLDDTDKRLDSVADIDAAVTWLADQPAVDDERIVAYGRSYGGFMVLAAITEYPDRWAAAVDFVGIADFETFLENTGEWRRSHREREYGDVENTELLERISPIHRVDQIRCPLFVQHGANDPRVPVAEARQIIEAVSDQNVPVESAIFEDEGHHTTSRRNRIDQFEQIASFLDEHVGDA